MFNRIFDMENPVWRALAVAADLLFLNLLTALCSLPLVTAGAALTALSELCLRLVRGEEEYILRGFFRSFRRNLKKGSLLGLLFLALLGILAVDYRYAGEILAPARIVAAAGLVVLLAVGLYAFALLARYENSVFGTVKNAAALAVGFFPKTLAMVFCTGALWFFSLRFVRYAAPLLIMFGFSLPVYIGAVFFNGIFAALEKKDE